MKFALGSYDVRNIKLTAAELGLTTSLIGNGTLVTLVQKLPVGWSVKEVQIKRDGTITNGSGTTVLNVGYEGDPGVNDIVAAADIEGALGYAAVTMQARQVVASTPKAIQAQVVTATAAPSAVAGLTIELVLVKVEREAG
jgi:hypothetical protein